MDQASAEGLRAQLLLRRCLDKLCAPKGPLRKCKAALLDKLGKSIIWKEVLLLSEEDFEDVFNESFKDEIATAVGPEREFWKSKQFSRFSEEFEVSEEIGRGSFGVVYKCTSKIDGQVYAVKCIQIPEDKTKDHIEKIMREVHALAQFSHPHVVRYFGAWTEFDKDVFTPEKPNQSRVPLNLQMTPEKTHPLLDWIEVNSENSSDWDDIAKSINVRPPGSFTPLSQIQEERVGRKIYIQMEFCPLDLSSYLQNEKYKLSPTRIFKQIVAGLEHVHSLGILHRDIKPTNILLDKNFNVKIGDFGSAKKGVDLSSTVGTASYIAPEIFESDQISEKVDIYSLGVLAHELWQNRRIKPASIARLMSLNPQDRPSCEQILNDAEFSTLINDE